MVRVMVFAFLTCLAALPAAAGGAPAGWDHVKWNNPNHRTPKYVIGRILVKHPHTPAGLRAALPEIQRAYPGTKILGSKGDKISVPGVGVIDVILAAGEGGRAWQWLPVDNSPSSARQAARHGQALARHGARMLAHGGPGPMPGWDAAKWNNPNHRTPKYVIGRILARYPHTPAGLRAALPEIEKEYPGTMIVGSKGDKLDIPGVGVIDVIQAAGEGGRAWQWLPVQPAAERQPLL